MKVATRGRNASFKAKMTTGNKTEDVLCFINPQVSTNQYYVLHVNACMCKNLQAFEVRRFKLFGMIQRQCYTCRVSPTRKVSALHKICHGNEVGIFS